MEKKQRLVHETRRQLCTVEEENSALKRKLHALEMRMDEVAEAHAFTQQQGQATEKALQVAREDCEALSEAYAKQGGELMAARESLTV